MSAERHLHPVDLETGQITCPRCENLKPGDLERAENALRKERRRNEYLEGLLDEKKETARQTHKDRKLFLALIDRWREKLDHPKAKVSNDRIDMLMKRRAEGYKFDPEVNGEPEPTFELAVDGLAAFRYVTVRGRSREGKPSEIHDRMGIVFGAGEDLERFARMGWRARENGWVD